MVYLTTIDKYWVDHIDAMQYLRDKVGLYGYAQQDPLIMYKQEAFKKFTQLLHSIKQDTLAIILRSDFASANINSIQLGTQQADADVMAKIQEAALTAPAYEPQAMTQP